MEQLIAEVSLCDLSPGVASVSQYLSPPFEKHVHTLKWLLRAKILKKEQRFFNTPKMILVDCTLIITALLCL